eukprot:1268945-Amphidinium_carterae.1
MKGAKGFFSGLQACAGTATPNVHQTDGLLLHFGLPKQNVKPCIIETRNQNKRPMISTAIEQFYTFWKLNPTHGGEANI